MSTAEPERNTGTGGYTARGVAAIVQQLVTAADDVRDAAKVG